MAQPLKALTENDRVNHHIYGFGTITLIGSSHTVIEFDKHGRKRFVTELLQIDRSDEPAPLVKKRKARPKARK